MSSPPVLLPFLLLAAASTAGPAPAAAAGFEPGHVFVCQLDGGSVAELDAHGNFVRSIGSLNFPTALAFGPEGRLWVTDQGRLQAFDATGTALVTTSLLDANDGLAFGPGGQLYVARYFADEVTILDRALNPIDTFASPSFDGPRLLGFSPDGQLLVPSTQGTPHLSRVDPTGAAVLDSFGLLTPTAAIAAPGGRVLASSTSTGKVGVFDERLAKLKELSLSPTAFIAPYGLALGMDGALLVADLAGDSLWRRTALDDANAEATPFGTPGTLLAPFGVAVAPARFQVKVKGELVEDGQREKVAVKAELSWLPGSCRAMLLFDDENATLHERLGGGALVFHGLDLPDAGTGPRRFHGTQRPAYDVFLPSASIDLAAAVKRDPQGVTTGVKNAKGSLHVAGAHFTLLATFQSTKSLD